MALAFVKLYGISSSKIVKQAWLFIALSIFIFYSLIVIQRNKDWKDQITIFTKTIETHPYCREAHTYLGLAYQEKGLYDKAIPEYLKALKPNPRYYSFMRPGAILQNLGFIYYDRGLYDKSEFLYKKALIYQPGNANIYLSLGNIYFKKSLYDKAIGEFKTALKINPFLVDARHNLGLAYEKQGLHKKAIVQFENILEEYPDDEGVRYNLRCAYEALEKAK
ncbi:tetratricopeptide repeat protein [Candidatus Omnitrophota bacterium]